MPSPIPILYEDQAVVVFDKPAGLLVVPDPKGSSKPMVDIVNAQCPPNELGKLYACHRLDRETSGVIIFARGQSNEEKMMDEFRKGTVEKRYIAFVRGKLRNMAGEMKSMIRDFHEQRYARYTKRDERAGRNVDRGGKLAITRYKVITVKHLFTVVEVYPLTGRTNQIRIHFSELGHPLLGERLYALGRDASVKFGRVALHASEITFKHPQTGKRMTVESELAKDMENFLNRY
jgi:RluA family pseudouridine synthase